MKEMKFFSLQIHLSALECFQLDAYTLLTTMRDAMVIPTYLFTDYGVILVKSILLVEPEMKIWK